MAVYFYSGLHPRKGTVPVHTFFSCDGGKPVVAMKSNIVIDGQSLQNFDAKEATFMLNAFEQFLIAGIHKTNQEYDYAVLVENLENSSLPDKVMEHVSQPGLTYMGIIIDHNPRKGTYTVGCGPCVFTSVTSDLKCKCFSSEFPSVYFNMNAHFPISYGSICRHEAKITTVTNCTADCTSQDSPLPQYSPMYNTGHLTSPLVVMPPLEQGEASSANTLECKRNSLSSRYPGDLEPSASIGRSSYKPPLQQAQCDSLVECSRQPDIPAEENESLVPAEAGACSLSVLEDFDALKPTISSFEKRNKIEETVTVTIPARSFK